MKENFPLVYGEVCTVSKITVILNVEIRKKKGSNIPHR